MTVNPAIDKSAAGPIEINAADGTVSVKSPSLFVAGDDRTRHTLIDRLLHLAFVRAIAFDRAKSTVEIEYDRTALDRRTALREFSEALCASEKSADVSLVRQYLDRVPGFVKRIERRIPDDDFLVVENLIVEYDRTPTTERTGARRTSIQQQLSVAGALPADVTKPWVGEVVIGGVRRLVNLTAAGGCLVMSIVGIVTPGIPTVPFVLATGYFLARSSPRLHQRFRNSKIFGQMVSDYQDHGGLRWSTKLKSILFTAGMIIITVVVVGATFPLLIVIGVMGTLGIYLVSRIRTLPNEPHPAAATPAMA
jgi:uncharacterized membrane protein YbaN (DUF454 family)